MEDGIGQIYNASRIYNDVFGLTYTNAFYTYIQMHHGSSNSTNILPVNTLVNTLEILDGIGKINDAFWVNSDASW